MAAEMPFRHFDIDGGFDSILNIADQEMLDCWDDPAAGKRSLDLAETIVGWIQGGSEALVSDLPVGLWENLALLLKQLDLEPEVRQVLQIQLAREYCTASESMAERCMELAALIAPAKPNEKVLRYLRRVSRCYIAGFIPETIVMCRAVLENAVAERYDREARSFPADASGTPTMRNRLDSAQRAKWITQEGRGSAWTIWIRGNKAAHDDPEATKDGLDTIRLTIGVLKELYSDVTDVAG